MKIYTLILIIDSRIETYFQTNNYGLLLAKINQFGLIKIKFDINKVGAQYLGKDNEVNYYLLIETIE